MPLALGRAIHHVETFLQLRQQLGDFLRGILQVVVSSYHDLIPRGSDAAKKSVMLPVVPAQANPADACVALYELLDHSPGVVATTVLDQNDLECFGALLEYGDKPPVQIEERSLCAVDGYDN